MRLAYADPPYPGQAKRHYADHPDYAGEVDHAELVAALKRDFEHWALSTSVNALPAIMCLCPADVRVLSWHKPTTPHYPGVLSYGWEPVILNGGRRPLPQAGAAVVDTLRASPEGYNLGGATPDDHLTGRKPPSFWRWLFFCFGAVPDEDEFVDLFPGSGAGGRAWAHFCEQPSLFSRPEPRRNTRRRVRKTHPQFEGMGAA